MASLLVGCGGGEAQTTAHAQVLRIESQAAMAGFELRFDSVTFTPSAMGFDTLGEVVQQMQRPQASGSSGAKLLVYVSGAAVMPTTWDSKPVPFAVAQGSTLLATRCADRKGNAVVCTARWVASL